MSTSTTASVVLERQEAGDALAFPEGFTWGAATAAFQIEGAHNADGKGPSIWDDFSHSKGKTYRGHNGDVACDHYNKLESDVAMMKEMGLPACAHGLCPFPQTPREGPILTVGSDRHAIADRFSIAWARLFPDGTPASENAAGVAFYRKLLTLLKEARIRAMITLYHWDLPSALQAKGGWLSPEAPGWFEAYAARCFELFDTDGLVDMWITFNEPWCMCALGYGNGVHAPGRNTDPGREPYIAAHHTLLAHARAYRLYKVKGYAHPIGIVLNSEWREPASSDPRDVKACAREMAFMLGWFAEPIFGSGDYPAEMRERCAERLPTFDAEQTALVRGSSDFFGFNWYSARMTAEPRTYQVLAALPSLIRMGMGEWNGLTGMLLAQRRAAKKKEGPGNYFADMNAIPSFKSTWSTTHMTWPVVPWALARILCHITEKYKPAGGIYITENGVAVAGEDLVSAALDTRPGKPGARRVAYVRSHIVAVQRAITKGADVRGYFLWSLMDNFEWAFGYAKRFGAVHVDYTTLVRTPKPVIPFYKSVYTANAVTPSPKESELDVFDKTALDFRVENW